jgi:transcription antitermination factor NusG
MFPGYLFACAAGILPGITAARGVVSTADGPIIVPPAALAKLLGECDADGIHKRGRLEPPPEPPRYAVGEPVRVIAGPLMGVIATVVAVDGHYLRVEINLFSRTTRVSVRSELAARLS